MLTYEMIAIADKNGKTYEKRDKNRNIRYHREKGFYNEKGQECIYSYLADYEYEPDTVNHFIHENGWQELKPVEVTMEEVEARFGYPVRIIMK